MHVMPEDFVAVGERDIRILRHVGVLLPFTRYANLYTGMWTYRYRLHPNTVLTKPIHCYRNLRPIDIDVASRQNSTTQSEVT
jgi:hypothetical protein